MGAGPREPASPLRSEGNAMAFMNADGFRLYYEDSGGDAPALLFLH